MVIDSMAQHDQRAIPSSSTVKYNSTAGLEHANILAMTRCYWRGCCSTDLSSSPRYAVDIKVLGKCDMPCSEMQCIARAHIL